MYACVFCRNVYACARMSQFRIALDLGPDSVHHYRSTFVFFKFTDAKSPPFASTHPWFVLLAVVSLFVWFSFLCLYLCLLCAGMNTVLKRGLLIFSGRKNKTITCDTIIFNRVLYCNEVCYETLLNILNIYI